MVATVQETMPRADRFGERVASPVMPAWRRVSWSAILAGMVIAMVLQMVLSLLGAGIGLSTIDPMRYSSPDPATFGMAAGIWWIVSSALSLFAGGWVAAHLAGVPEKVDASLHGLLTWGVATILAAYLIASTLGAAVAGGTRLAAGAAQSPGVNGAVADAMGKMPRSASAEALKNQATAALAAPGGVGNTATATPTPGADSAAPPTDEQKAATEAKARQAMDHAAKRSSQIAFATLLALVVGAFAATLGGALAGRRYWAPAQPLAR